MIPIRTEINNEEVIIFSAVEQEPLLLNTFQRCKNYKDAALLSKDLLDEQSILYFEIKNQLKKSNHKISILEANNKELEDKFDLQNLHLKKATKKLGRLRKKNLVTNIISYGLGITTTYYIMK